MKVLVLRDFKIIYYLLARDISSPAFNLKLAETWDKFLFEKQQISGTT